MGTFVDDDGVVQVKYNKWNQIHDFTKREDGKLNYSLMPPSELKFHEYALPGVLEDSGFIFEYDEEYGGTLKGQTKAVADSLMAFDITTSAKEAQ